MSNGVSRREFLKYSLATGALIAAGEGIVNNVMAQAAKGITEVDKLTVWVLTDNYYDTNRADVKNTKRYRSKSGKSIHAEHGVSFYVETLVNGKASTCMFDFGLDPVGVHEQYRPPRDRCWQDQCLQSEPRSLRSLYERGRYPQTEPVALASGTPFYVGEEAFARRYSLRPGAAEPTDLGQLKTRRPRSSRSQGSRSENPG